MFKIFGIAVLVLAFFVILALMLFASAILSIIRKLRKFIYGDVEPKGDYTGRRQQQYSYRGGTSGQQSSNTQKTHYNQQSANNYTDSETIIDTRSPRQTYNRIFDDNEGEYVDFVEEK